MSRRGERHSGVVVVGGVVVGIVAIVALVPAMAGCQKQETRVAAAVPATARATGEAAPTAAADPKAALQCQGLRGDDSAAIPWPPLKARLADYPSPRNSDGTLKRLPPPPPSEPDHVLVLRYNDFGPPSMQLGLVGDAWWSWEAGGSFEAGDEFDVRVVVYQGRARAEIEHLYPTVKGLSDYRLLSRADALRYLDARIAELSPGPPDPDEYDFGPLREELEETRRLIIGCLPEAGATTTGR